MPKLTVSHEVFFKIRSLRLNNDESEDRILSRLMTNSQLGNGNRVPNKPTTPAPGFYDATYGLHFPEGMEIFRVYKGQRYGARVTGGRWVLDADGQTYASLNQLSQGVIDGNENAWMFWFYRNAEGETQRIAELRDPAMVQKRPRKNHRRPLGDPRPADQPVSAQAFRQTEMPVSVSPRPEPQSHPEPSSDSAPEPEAETAPGSMPWEPALAPT